MINFFVVKSSSLYWCPFVSLNSFLLMQSFAQGSQSKEGKKLKARKKEFRQGEMKFRHKGVFHTRLMPEVHKKIPKLRAGVPLQKGSSTFWSNYKTSASFGLGLWSFDILTLFYEHVNRHSWMFNDRLGHIRIIIMALPCAEGGNIFFTKNSN